jgi:cation-transporting ATPase 13A2
VNAVQKGIDDVTKEQRLTLFNKNEIDIEGKSTVSLLVEEVV